MIKQNFSLVFGDQPSFKKNQTQLNSDLKYQWSTKNREAIFKGDLDNL